MLKKRQENLEWIYVPNLAYGAAVGFFEHDNDIVGENDGKLALRICPGCSVPETYRSPD